MAIAEDAEAGLAAKFAVMRELLDERQWRVYLGTEARALGRGGVAAVARASGASQVTVAAGAAQAADPGALAALARGRSRRPGAGRPKAEDAQPGLRQALGGVLEEATRGDPVSEITWCSLSLRDLRRQLAARGFRCGKDAIARMLRQEGYSLQAMAKVLEGRQHPDRDGQFRHVNAMIRAFAAAGYPVVSADAKKKEQLGPYHRDGRTWRPAGNPVKVRDHDFPDQELGKITPYGVYDIAANRGFVSVGTSCDTAAFAVNALRLWWQREGALRYPGAARLLVTADAGGSNGYRSRLWKDQLAVLAAETGLKISVVHFPPGTSKWNRIEHRLFCHITRTWRTRPLMTADDAVAGIAATVTSQGLKCTAVRDDAAYPEGAKVSGERLRYLQDRVVVRHGPHRDWNYTILPAPRPAPEPEPEPGPGPGRAGPDPALVRALAALAGIGDPDALAGELALAWDAAREHRLTLERGRGRIRRCGNSNASLARLALPAILTAAACRYNAGMSCALIGTLLGVHHATIGDATRYARPVLEQHGLTITTGRPRISTLRDLREHASATGITIPLPQPHPPPSRTRPPPAPDTPEPANLKTDASQAPTTAPGSRRRSTTRARWPSPGLSRPRRTGRASGMLRSWRTRYTSRCSASAVRGERGPRRTPLAIAPDRLPGRGGDLVRLGRPRRAVRVRPDPPAARHRRRLHHQHRDHAAGRGGSLRRVRAAGLAHCRSPGTRPVVRSQVGDRGPGSRHVRPGDLSPAGRRARGPGAVAGRGTRVLHPGGDPRVRGGPDAPAQGRPCR